MNNAQKQIEAWIDALETERLDQQDAFKILLEKKSVHQRVQDGFTWYPLALKSSGFAVGAIPYVVIEKTKEIETNDKFQAGRPVQIFQHGPNQPERPIKGIVHWISRRQMKVYLHSHEIPHWLHQSSIGIDLLYDEQTFRDMRKTMEQVLELPENHSMFPTREILYGDKPLETVITKEAVISPELNSSQTTAIHQAMAAEHLHIIHGPPGTGKTTTLIHLIEQLTIQGEQILVCASSNAAVDWITGLLHRRGLNVLRMGHLSRIDPDVLDCSLESMVFSNPESKEIKKLRIKADEYRKLAGQYKRSFGPSERNQRRLLKKEAKEMSEWASELERRIIMDVMDRAQIITCTLSSANSKYLADRSFKTCVIDEAAQALQGACWMAMLKAERVILAGDPFQLPPTVKSQEAAKKDLGLTLLDLAIQKKLPLSLLTTQYRMNKIIMQFSNIWFYQGALSAHESVEDHQLRAFDQNEPVLEFIDTAGCGFDEELHPETRSYFNKDEYRLLREHMDPLLERLYPDVPEVGILSPYKAQVNFIKDSFEEEAPSACNCTIQTIDGFQGQERDIIYISLVRSNENQIIGFLKDYRRMNVAMTRARKKLVLIGDSSTIGTDPFYKALLEYIDRNEAYRSAWEFIYTS